ncbi:MAG: sugar ABC transporter substrate-binding protein [Anaerolineae bacterium]|nr:sugar ABC transporter substrate-binding protein [Anaerolineae bacterium]
MSNPTKWIKFTTAFILVLSIVAAGSLGVGARPSLQATQVATVASTPDPLAGADFKGVKIGMSTLPLSNPFFVELTAGAREEAAKLGIEVVVVDSNNDPNKQVSDLQNFMSGGFAGFIVTAVDPKAIASVSKDALAKGMKVVAHTSDLGAENQTALVWAQEHDMGLTLGRQAGEWANQHIPKDGTLKLAILNYDIIPQVIQRREGIVDGIKEVYKGKMEVVGTQTAGDPEAGLKASETWLQANPDLNMIVGINDGGALGAYQAVIAADKNDPDKFFVGGIDATQEALAAIKSGGSYQATVDQQPRAMGALCVRTLALALKGLPYDKVTAIQLAPVNRSNVDQWLKPKATPEATAAK